MVASRAVLDANTSFDLFCCFVPHSGDQTPINPPPPPAMVVLPAEVRSRQSKPPVGWWNTTFASLSAGGVSLLSTSSPPRPRTCGAPLKGDIW